MRGLSALTNKAKRLLFREQYLERFDSHHGFMDLTWHFIYHPTNFSVNPKKYQVYGARQCLIW